MPSSTLVSEICQREAIDGLADGFRSPVCIQITVTGGGSYIPAGNLNFPGAYKATDPGILFNPYQGDAANRVSVFFQTVEVPKVLVTDRTI